MVKYIRYFFAIAFIFASSTITSCSDGGINIFSLSDDVQLGTQLNQQILTDTQEYPVYKGDPSVKAYIISRIFNHILTSPQIENKNVFNYQFEIIDNDSVLNAFSIPGGYVYIYKGLLKYLDSEAALAGVLGHEIAHAERRHATQRMTAEYGVSALLGLILGQNPSELETIAANLFTGLGFLANSRADENEADQYSFKYLRDTRYYPGGVKFFFEKMRDEGLIDQNSSKITIFLSTHPDPIARISTINGLLTSAGIEVKDYKATGDGIFKTEYDQNIRSKLH